jgi:hypothetical protein
MIEIDKIGKSSPSRLAPDFLIHQLRHAHELIFGEYPFLN